MDYHIQLNRYIDFTLGILIFVTGLSYTEHPLGSSVIRLVMVAILILALIRHVNFNQYKFVIYLIMIEIVIPLILIIFGVYNLNTSQSLMYMVIFSLYLLLDICLADFYRRISLHRFINVWQVSITILLAFLAIIYRGINLNLKYLFSLTISNQRYGDFLLAQRYGMGFKNVNTLALFSTILLVCSLYNLINRRLLILSFVDIVMSSIFILNAESRTPFVLIIILIFCYFISLIRRKKIKFYVKNIILCLETLFASIFTYMFITGNTSNFYSVIDNFSSRRLSYGTSAISYLRSVGNIFWGVGPLNSSFIPEKIFGNTITLDNSLEYYVFTVGLLGCVLIFVCLLLIFFKINKSGSDLGFIISTFYFTYSIFENTIFLPVSVVSLFCLTIIFSVLEDYNARKIIDDSYNYLQ